MEEMDRRVTEENLFDQSRDEVQGTNTHIVFSKGLRRSLRQEVLARESGVRRMHCG